MLKRNSLSGIHRRIMYRCVALLMLLVMAFLLPANHLLTKEAYAASQKKKYIAEYEKMPILREMQNKTVFLTQTPVKVPKLNNILRGK